MSLFICDECGCVENTNCANNYNGERDQNFRNWSLMEMHGWRSDTFQDERQKQIMICSECNTGTWHGEFDKNKATEVEILMGEQLRGDEHNIFTFHPMWKEYSSKGDSFDIDVLKEYDIRRRYYSSPRTPGKTVYDGLFWPGMLTPTVRSSPKIGRNESCKCLSGKKYKKCCGKIK